MKTVTNISLLLLGSAINAAAQNANNVTDVVISHETSSNSAVGWGLIILLIIQILVIRSISLAIRSISQSDIFSKKSNNLSALLIVGGILLSFHGFAQNTPASEPLVSFSDTDINILIVLNLILSLVVMWMYYQFRQILKLAGIIKQEETQTALFNIEGFLTRAVPVEKEAAIQFEHEYDGIRELDNVLPPWWLWMFYTTIAFSFIYLIHYHISPIKALEKIGMVGPGEGQEELYKLEMEQAEKEKQAYMAQMANKVNEENVTALTDANEIAQGKEVFMTNCITCHGKEAQGGAGPNLTDDYWLHGGGIKNIFKTIKYGVPEKGMISWESQLSPKQIQQVASYILTLRGTNPPGAKEPQGELWKDNESTTSATADTLSNNKSDTTSLNKK